MGHEYRCQRPQHSDDDLAVFPGNWKRAPTVFLKTAYTQNKSSKKQTTEVRIRYFKVLFTTTPILLFIHIIFENYENRDKRGSFYFSSWVF